MNATVLRRSVAPTKALMEVIRQFSTHCCFPFFPSHPLSLSFPLIRCQRAATLPFLLVIRMLSGFHASLAWVKQKRATCDSSHVVDHWLRHSGHLKLCNWRDAVSALDVVSPMNWSCVETSDVIFQKLPVRYRPIPKNRTFRRLISLRSGRKTELTVFWSNPMSDLKW